MTQTLLGQPILVERIADYTHQFTVRFEHPELKDLGSFILSDSSELFDTASGPFHMDPEKKAGWMAALLSDEYPQTRGALARHNESNTITGYCCLGVYCKLHDVPIKFDAHAFGSGIVYFGKAGTGGSYFPEELAGDLPIDHQRVLGKLNDAGWTFDKIVKVIEVCL